MKLEAAQQIAAIIKSLLIGTYERFEVAGSIRRRRPEVNDIDLVIIPQNRARIDVILGGYLQVKMAGPKLARYEGSWDIFFPYSSIPARPLSTVQVDIYYATPENFATLLLIRTGSVENNIRLCNWAKKKGWHLHANGDGLFNERGERIAGDSERSIYEALGFMYQEPWGRG